MHIGTIKQLSSLALAVSLAIANTTSAQEFSQVVVFGDSLSDMGRLKEVNTKFIARTLGLQNSFTTNPDPTWAGVLANSYGHKAEAHTDSNKAGTNYAVGGARVSVDNPNPAIPKIPSVRSQLTTYFGHTPNADPNALYAVWIGANDLSTASEEKDSNKKSAIITTAAKEQADEIARLHAAGAKYILVPSIPDLSLTQRYAVSKKADAGSAKLGSMLYNNTLYGELSKSDANVIPANTFALLQEAVGNYQAFGFKVSNTDYACKKAPIEALTSIRCNRSLLKTPTANEDYIFADDIHPSGRTHRILAQYYRSLIEAPAEMAQLPSQLLNTSNNHRLHQKINTLNHRPHSVWAEATATNGKTTNPNVLIGLDVAGKSHHTGVYFSHNAHSHSVSTTLSASSKEIGVGLYHQHNLGKFRLSADVGVNKLTLDTDRQIVWDGMARSHQGKGDGRRYHAGLMASYGIDFGKATIRPSVGVNAQKLRVDDITENNPHLSTALQYELPEQQSLQGVVGLDVKYALNDRIDLNADISHHHEFHNNGDTTVKAKLTSLQEYGRSYALPVGGTKADSTQRANLGATVKFDKASLNAGITATHTSGTSTVGGYVGLQMGF